MKFAIVVFFGMSLAAAAAPFQNLGFDEGQTNHLSYQVVVPNGFIYGEGLTSDLLPGWTLTHGGSPVTTVSFNSVPGDGDYVALFDRQASTNSADFPFFPEGKYALSLGFSHSLPYELIQSGEIPQDAHFLSYTSQGAPFEVRIDNQLIQPLFPGNYFGAFEAGTLEFDIASFAGQNVTLSLREGGSMDASFQNSGFGFLDSIAFAVPEPLPVILCTVAGAWLVVWRMFRACGQRHR